MSGARPVELLRHDMSGELLYRVVLHPDDTVQENLHHAAVGTSGGFAARVAEIPSDILTFAALH